MTVGHSNCSVGYMQHSSNPKRGGLAEDWTSHLTMSIGDSSSKAMGKRPGKRPGRKPSKIDERAKLERSRQSARECRARKKLRYQYLEELVSNREKAVFALRDELELYKQWCIQLENGGPIPESLLKAIASEDVAMKRRQMTQLTRSLLQQRQQQSFQFSPSSSSSTSPDLSLASSQREHQQHRQINVVQPQMILNDVLHKPQIRHTIPDHVIAQRQQQLQLQQQAAGSALLQRQLPFDHSRLQEHQSKELTPIPNTVSSAPVSQEHMQGVMFQQSICNQKQQQHSFLQPNQHLPNTTLPSHGAYPSFHPDNMRRTIQTMKSQDICLPRVSSEPKMKHGHSFDTSKIFSNTRGDGNALSNMSENHRRRSNSNPVTMESFSRPNVNITSPDDLPSSLQDFITSHSSPYQAVDQPSLGVGLFSGSVLNNKPSSSSFNIPTTIAVEDSSSSDDTINEQHLFQSSMTTHKRKVTASFLPESVKRSLASSNSAPSTTDFDAIAGLLNLENSYHFGLKTASNTSSPLSYGHVSSNAPSPAHSPRYSGLSNSTPSSCATASPAPLSSLSSVLEFSASSPRISSSTYSPALETSPSAASSLTNLSTDSLPTHYTAPAMTFLHEPVPDWYSFLADLEDGTTSTLTTQQGASSGPSMTSIPKQHQQSITPTQSFMNVPDIINELLNSHDHNV
ncbi:hypothetical protein BsWGS_14375 [Bradybaena similaris]